MERYQWETAPKKGKPVRLLVVEDNPDHRAIMTKALQEAFAAAVPLFTTDVETTIAQLKRFESRAEDLPALIILDLYCPDAQGGLFILERLRDIHSPLRPVPVIIFSHSAADEDVLHTYQLGATCYLVKPTDFTEWTDFFTVLRKYWLEVATLPA